MPPAENSETRYELPPPVNEAGEEANDHEEGQPSGPEIAGKLTAPKSSKSKAQITDFHLKDFAVSQPTNAATTTTTNDNPQVAEDNDLIEKEWVAKAKKIIDDNRENPKIQSKEMNLFKADYMNKRYNKIIKISE